MKVGVSLITNPFHKLVLTPYQQRTLDILQVAEFILLRYGYSKSTIDEIASVAKLGKGTIYLHWKSKDELFQALFNKISAEIIQQVLLEVQKNKSLVNFDKLVSTIYRMCYDRELIVALFTKDNKLLGRFLDKKNTSQSQETKFKSLMDSIQMYRQYHLVKEDMPIELQVHTIHMLLISIFTYDNYIIKDLNINKKVEILEKVIRSTFVPETCKEIEDPLYKYILRSLEDLLHFHVDRVLNKTIK
ncbi:TetR/AcrR family transcriptional regulator [Geosporobacter ferrireducens]|uniref:TetR/AcrR family transcriptional regulator n=1 Tax=Geosporobacter ferrireducens TaxID=1424294 RepID=UPI00139EBA13|nr:TetR/AcrR family transcriptional regulator [Geosporobacter ferrireducens]MTI56589.1 TetR/AcrR family transcriptional regulator [Geosporobacter ferrireducens]